MTHVKEGIKFIGHVMIEELQKGFQHFTRYSLPAMDVVVSREVGSNIICVGGANAISTGLTTGTLTEFNYMAISTDSGAVARATTTIPGSVGVSKFMSTVITPTVDNTPPTSKTTWEYTYVAAAGRTLIMKFGMEVNDTGSGSCFNEYLFTVAKDNTNNDLKLTYTVSIAP